MTDQTIPWALRVLRAFRDAMDDNKPANVPSTVIGWPKPGSFEGAYQLYVWYDPDLLSQSEGNERHDMVVKIAAVLSKDAGNTDQTELEQALIAFYGARAALAAAAEDNDSQFNSLFEGAAYPHEDRGGIRPTADRDFDRHSAILEHWRVVGACPVFTPPGS